MSDDSRTADADYPLEDVLRRRWSPYGFAGRSLTADELRRCLEAVRWSASSYNEQPWRLIVALKSEEEAFQQLLGCLVEANQGWARQAGALLLTVTRRHFRHNGKPNGMAEHDIGLAIASLTVQATAMGLHVHQMAGIDRAAARDSFQIPEGFDPLTAVAIGHAAVSSDPGLRERDSKPRERMAQSQWVFQGEWEQAWTE